MAASDRASLRYIAEDGTTGYAEAAYRLVRALRGAGVRVEHRGWSKALVRFSRDDFPDEQAEEGAPTIVHLVPEHYSDVRKMVPDGPFIAHTVWETDRLPQHWPELLNTTDRVIVPTMWNREVFAASGVSVPIDVVPHVACVPAPGTPFLVPDDVTVFYTIGRWDQRKAMFHTVEAFLRAFDADDPVVLVIKTGERIEMPAERWGTSNPRMWTTSWPVARLVSQHRKPARIQLEVGRWTTDQIAGLHARGDCYVALPHGEGWGLGAFDACAYGNPVIATAWGGFLEFLDGEHAFLVEAREVAVESQAFLSYSHDQHWAEPDVDHAADLLRRVAADLPAARARASMLRDRVLDDYAPARVAATLRAAIRA